MAPGPVWTRPPTLPTLPRSLLAPEAVIVVVSPLPSQCRMAGLETWGVGVGSPMPSPQVPRGRVLPSRGMSAVWKAHRAQHASWGYDF